MVTKTPCKHHCIQGEKYRINIKKSKYIKSLNRPKFSGSYRRSFPRCPNVDKYTSSRYSGLCIRYHDTPYRRRALHKRVSYNYASYYAVAETIAPIPLPLIGSAINRLSKPTIVPRSSGSSSREYI